MEPLEPAAEPFDEVYLVEERLIGQIGLLEVLLLDGAQLAFQIALYNLVIADVLSIHTRLVPHAGRISHLSDEPQPASFLGPLEQLPEALLGAE